MPHRFPRKVGDAITADAIDENGASIARGVTYAWYRTDGTATSATKISGETAASYTVQTIDVDYFIYCEATYNGTTVQSKTTGRITAQEVTALSVTGMSGKVKNTDKTATIPVVGDVLSATTDPAGAANLVSYQWYRGSSAITGATGSSDDIENAGSWIFDGTVDNAETYNYLPAVASTKVSNMNTATVGLTVYRALTSNTLKFSNNALDTTTASGYKTYTTPQVGSYVHATVSPTIDGLTYNWYLDDAKNGTNITGDANNNHLLVDESYVGHTIICVASDSTSTTTRSKYYGASVESAATSAVVVSDKTIKEIKVVEYVVGTTITTAKEFAAATQVTKLDASKAYIIYALNSDDEIITTGLDYTWSGSKKSQYLSETQIAYGGAMVDAGIVTVTVTPNGKDIVGDAAEYTFTTELTSSTNTISQITMTNGNSLIESTTGLDIVSAKQNLTVTPYGLSSVASVQWYEAANTSAAGVAIDGAADMTLDISVTATTNGKVYYAVLTDPNKNTYTSERVIAIAPVAVSGTFTAKSLTAAEAFTSETQIGTIALVDQFGNSYTLASAVNGGATVEDDTGVSDTDGTAATETVGFGIETDGKVYAKASGTIASVTAKYIKSVTIGLTTFTITLTTPTAAGTTC